MALNITLGNDIQLRLLVTRDSAPFPIELATGVQVNIVSIFNRRTPLEFQISDGAVYVTVKALPIGTYGIEVKGLLNKFDWRTYADAAIVVTSATKAGDTSITVASDAYDVTMEVSMYVGTLPLNNGGTYVDGISVLKGYFYALDGSTYLALVNSPTTAPSEASDEWALLARKGHDFSYSDFTPEQISALQKPATDALAEMNTLKTTVETSEATRAENENTRVTSESTRVTDEATRVTNENGRVEGEQTRATAEQARVTDENTRLNAETLRDTQEGQRVTNEQQRTTDEAGRVTAENDRVSAETARASAETTRASAETTRVSNENTRVSNEQARVTAEAGRQATLNAKENSANKQNSLATDGTNTKYPTVDAVNGNFATQVEAEANTESTKFMSALRVFQSFVKNANSYVFNTLNTTSKTVLGSINELFVNKVDKTTKINNHPLSGDITIIKSDIGVGNIDNTSDINKPVSTPQQAALDLKLDTTAVKQVTGASTTDVISQKTVTDILVTKADHGYSSNPKSLKQVEDAKENSANKQNSLNTDGTGTKFPTVDAVNAALDKGSLILDYTHSANTEIIVNSVDVDANTFISANHGLMNNTFIYPTLNDSNNIAVYPLQVYSGGIKQQGYYVVNKSDNTFQISATASGAPIDITSVGDLSKWHFETSPSSAITFTGLNSNRYRLVVEGNTLRPSVNQYILINDLNMTSTWMSPMLTSFALPFINTVGMTLRGYLDILVEAGSDFFTTIRTIGTVYNVDNNNAATFTANSINNTLIQSIKGQYSNITQLTFNDIGRLANGAKIKIYKV